MRVSWPSRSDPGRTHLARDRRTVAAACVAIALLVGGISGLQRIGELDDRARANAARDFAEREFAGGNSIGADKPTMYAARSLIPRDEPYRLEIGPEPPGATELTEIGLNDWVRFFLMPRRPDPAASWVICYACDPAAIPGYEPVWEGEDGFSVGRITG